MNQPYEYPPPADTPSAPPAPILTGQVLLTGQGLQPAQPSGSSAYNAQHQQQPAQGFVQQQQPQQGYVMQSPQQGYGAQQQVQQGHVIQQPQQQVQQGHVIQQPQQQVQQGQVIQPPQQGFAAGPTQFASPMGTGHQPGTHALLNPDKPQSMLELSISCRDLKDLDWVGKSDPFVQVFIKTVSRGNTRMDLVGQTEIVENNLNPNFKTPIITPYHFEEEQTVLLKVWDADKDRTTFKDADNVGSAAFNLGQLVSSKGQTMMLKLTLENQTKSRGLIIIRAEEASSSNDAVSIDFTGINLINRITKCYRFLHKCSPVIRILRSREDGQWVKVAETEPSHRNLNPRYRTLKIRHQALCNGDNHRPLKLEVVDVNNRDENGILMCTAQTSLNELIEKSNTGQINLKTWDGKADGGQLRTTVNIVKMPSFLEYVRGGLELKLSVAVDFTASNGPPEDPDSLHHISANGQMNKYQRILNSVGRILLDYDSDQQIGAYGFGALINGETSHAFQLTLDPNRPEVYGLQGLNQAYLHSLHSVKLYGPTLFSPIIFQAVEKAMTDDSGAYHILLILTDGVISDMDLTKQAVIQASHTALSIIIVGVGDADFANMRELDADDGPLRAGNLIQAHDNLQFVPFKAVKNSSSQLSKEVLAELPDQVIRHLMSKKILPAKPTEANPNVVVANPDYAHATTGLPLSYLQQQGSVNNL